MAQSIIVIPVYKSIPDMNELISFNQCIKILYKHPMCLITHKELNITHYSDLFINSKVSYSVIYFENSFFENITGYNRLMLSLEFYKRFIKYEYMLLYQLDAYVFKDELDYWCTQGYDYIGAPLIEDKNGNANKYFLKGGNGGFSLRKTKYFLETLSYLGPIIKPKEIFINLREQLKNRLIHRYFSFIIRSFGYHNNVKYFINKTYINEDMFWTLNLHVSWVNKSITKKNAWRYPKMPSEIDAMKFSFERYPSFLFKENNFQLPFGCHAWQKFEYETFWIKFI